MSTDKKPLLQAYLLLGDDALKVKAMLDRLTERIAETGDISFNQQIFDGGQLRSAESLLDALNTLPFAAPLRLVVLKNLDSASKVLTETLVEYLKSPARTTVLVLCAQSLAKNTRLYKAIAALSEKAIIDCSTAKRSEIPGLIAKMASTQGLTIDRTASDALIERVGTSTLALANEIEKLGSIPSVAEQGRIRVRDVETQVQHMVEPKPWDLTDALALKNLPVCLQLLGRIERLTPTASFDYTVMRLYAQCLSKIRELLTVKALRRRGVGDIPAALKRPEWQVRTTLKGAELYREKELIAILQQAPALEQSMKSRPEAGRLLERWLIQICRQGD